MAVEVRYHVIRDGEEVAVYLTKREADEYDKMLDIAFELSEFIERASQIKIDEGMLEELSIHLAQNRAEVIRILRAQKPGRPAKKTPEAAPAVPENPPAPEVKKTKDKGEITSRGKKK